MGVPVSVTTTSAGGGTVSSTSTSPGTASSTTITTTTVTTTTVFPDRACSTYQCPDGFKEKTHYDERICQGVPCTTEFCCMKKGAGVRTPAPLGPPPPTSTWS